MLKRVALCGVAALIALGGATSCDSCGGKWHVVQLKLTNVHMPQFYNSHVTLDFGAMTYAFDCLQGASSGSLNQGMAFSCGYDGTSAMILLYGYGVDFSIDSATVTLLAGDGSVVADHVRMELTEARQKQYDGSDPFCERDGALPGA